MCGSFSELHSAARKPAFCGGVSGAKLSRSAISSRMRLLPRLMVSLSVWWLWLLLARGDACMAEDGFNFAMHDIGNPYMSDTLSSDKESVETRQHKALHYSSTLPSMLERCSFMWPAARLSKSSVLHRHAPKKPTIIKISLLISSKGSCCSRPI